MKIQKPKGDEPAKTVPKDSETWDRESSLYQQLLTSEDDPKSRQIALLIALVFHILLITVTFPSFSRPELKEEKKEAVYVPRWTPPPPPKIERPKQVIKEELNARKVPIPDPTPDEPEPIREPEPEPEPIPIPPDVEVIIGAPEPPPLAEGPVRAGFGGVTYPVLIESTKVQPKYPELARKAKVTGNVILEAIVRKDGTVGDVKVLRSPGSNLGFEQSAIEAVKQWRYKPGVQNGRPVDVYFTIVVEFILK
ncbi:MAG: energy transducer TonB [Acidobacteriota bacterium]|jgi:protein TonB